MTKYPEIGEIRIMAKKKERFREIAVHFVKRLRLEEKACPVCGNKFTGVKKRRFCSLACGNKANYEKHAEQYRQSRMKKYYAEKEKKPAKKKSARKGLFLSGR